MRVGVNPNKNDNVVTSDYFHQVVIPVYIPNQEGYFKDSFRIFQYCLESLFKTSHNKTYFTIVNNGCCSEVVSYISELQENKYIHEVIHTSNIGKLNAILKGIAGQNYPLITVADADVLFVNDWQKNTYLVFDKFPKAGVVSPSPSSRVVKQYTHNLILSHFFSKKLSFSDVVNKEAMKHFAESIENPDFYNQYHLEKYLTISNNNFKAVVGASHFVSTYKSVIFNDHLKKNCDFGLGGDSEEEFLDKPAVDLGYWRLSTTDNYAFHMGNVEESWMKEQLDGLKNDDSSFNEIKITTCKSNRFLDFLQFNFFLRLLTKPYLWPIFLQYKGLSKEASKNY